LIKNGIYEKLKLFSNETICSRTIFVLSKAKRKLLDFLAGNVPQKFDILDSFHFFWAFNLFLLGMFTLFFWAKLVLLGMK